MGFARSGTWVTPWGVTEQGQETSGAHHLAYVS